jgi:aminocarboxymuconate-semialdehyde decarboxylase
VEATGVTAMDMVVDVHAHYYPPGYLDELARSPEPYAITRDSQGRAILMLHGHRIVTMTREMTDVEFRLEAMARAGIQCQVLSVTIPNVYLGAADRRRALARIANEGLAEVVHRHPEHFAGLACLPLPDPADAAEELRRAVQDLGLRGALVGSNVNGRYLDDPAFEPVFATAEELEAPLFIHPMPPASPDATYAPGLVPLLGFVFDTSVSAVRMVTAGVLERHPKLTVILGHLGGTLPYLFQRLDNGYRAYPELRRALPHPPSHYLRALYYDTVSFSLPSLQCALSQVGPERLLLGTDYPHVIGDMAGALRTIEALGLPETGAAAILGGTARRVFRRPGGTPG